MDFTTDSFFHKYECAADAADSLSTNTNAQQMLQIHSCLLLHSPEMRCDPQLNLKWTVHFIA